MYRMITSPPRLFFVIAVLFCSLLIFTKGTTLASENQTSNNNTVTDVNEFTIDDAGDFFDLSIEQLMEVEVDSTATLTESKPRLVPAAVTTITEDQILASGARSLFELLDIYVPNLQWWRNHWEPDNMGLRGILSDRDDKYLLLVNGRAMNERTHYGALSERDLVLLTDIHHIDIVRGPGSAMYGPGAVSMVINIVTHNSETFEGTEVTTRLGAIEEYYSTEIKHGRKFDDEDGGIFAYAGIAEYHGADKYDAPQVFGFDFPTTPVDDPGTIDVDESDAPLPQDGHLKGKPFTYVAVNDGEAHRDLPPLKLYAEMIRGNWNVWARYTRGGKQFFWPTSTLIRSPYGWSGSWILPYEDCTYGYQQATGFIGHSTELNEKTNLDTSFSYDMFDFENRVHTWMNNAHREDKYIGKATVRHDINNQHKVAVGTEVLHGEYGFNSPGWPNVENTLGEGRWSTNMYSGFGEYQWTINDQWTTFIGGRVDDHTYTNTMFSPRAALIHTPTEKDTYKLMWSRSVRANYEEELKKAGIHNSRPEKLDNIELRYERKHNENLDFAASAFTHYNLELIGWSNAADGQSVVGTLKEWGIEAEAQYHTERTKILISHGFTKMLDFELAEPNMIVSDPLIQFSAHPYGYGDDLQRWANHITKITAQHQLNEQWTVDGSLRIYWGFPGLKDYAEYNADNSGYPLDWKRAYRKSCYLNLGLNYKHNENFSVHVHGYNLLGMFEKDLNKRNYGGEGYADFRSHAAAVGISAIYRTK